VVKDSAFGGAMILSTLLNIAEGVGAWAAREGSEETNRATEALEERAIDTVGDFSSSKILGIRRLVTVVVSKGFTPMLILGGLTCISLRFKGCTWIMVLFPRSPVLLGPAGSSSVTV
jgi:hypothetical protein